MSAALAGRHRSDPQRQYLRRALDWIRGMWRKRFGPPIPFIAPLVMDPEGGLEERAMAGLPEPQEAPAEPTEEELADLRKQIDPRVFAFFSHAPSGDDTNASYWARLEYNWDYRTGFWPEHMKDLGEDQ